MKKVDFVFVLLTYRNSIDLKEFFNSAYACSLNAAYVVVDAFFDDESSNNIKKIADMNHADYLQIPNKGYSFGNNYGIKYASEKYDYSFIVVSNPDIVIKQLSIGKLKGLENCVIGPMIINARGQMQNPMYPFRVMLAQKLIYRGLKNDKKIFFALGIILNKIVRKLFLLRTPKNASVYQVHGSFVIFGKSVIEKLKYVYDENMFLFAEESYLAVRLRKERINSIYCSDIQVFHKEDGSMNFRDDINEQLRTANIYVFEKYYRFN